MRFLLLLALFTSSCASILLFGRGHYYLKKTKHEPEAHWSYEGDTGPDHWAELSPDYSLASKGRKQSPINIETSRMKEEELPELIFRYQGEMPDFINNGHTLQHKQENDGREIEIGGKHYRLEQFHLHTPSEHTVDGSVSLLNYTWFTKQMMEKSLFLPFST